MKRTHGMSHTPEYSAFRHAKERCEDTTDQDYKTYGGRGIEFRFDSMEPFLQEPTLFNNGVSLRKPGEMLDRIDNDGHYESGNLRWASKRISSLNRRRPVDFRRAEFWRNLLLALDLDPSVCYGTGLFGKENYSVPVEKAFPSPCVEKVRQEVAA